MAKLVSLSTDVQTANRIVNDPAVRPGLDLGYDGPLDIGPLVGGANQLYLGEHGGFCAVAGEGNTFSTHVFVLPEGRGKWALEAAREVISDLFDRVGAALIWVKTPVANKGARMFCRLLGFHFQGEMSLRAPNGFHDFAVFSMERR